jgi:hypothetical protein
LLILLLWNWSEWTKVSLIFSVHWTHLLICPMKLRLKQSDSWNWS